MAIKSFPAKICCASALALLPSYCNAMAITYYDGDVGASIQELASTLLGYVGGITLLILVAIGIYYMSSNGDPNQQKKAKNALSYAVLGLIIVILSYSILEVIDRVGTR